METVCHVITKLELGGAQEVALYTVSHLDRRKFRPVLVSGPGGLLTEDARRIPHLDVVILPTLIRHIRPLSDLVALVGLVRLFRRLRPTIVHTHSSKAGILGRWAAWLARTPIIVHTIHGYGITPVQPAWLQRVLVWLERVTAWATTHWIAVSQADLAKGMEWRLFKTNVSLIRPGIDPAPFQSFADPAGREKLRCDLGAGPADQLVGTVACLKPQKAPEDFVAVAKRVCAVVPQARFVIVGDGELRPRIEHLLQQEGLTERVRLAGWRRDVPALMQAFDAFLLTSHWEGLPRVLLEARAAGLPIVATKAGGADEAIPEGSDAYVSNPGDIPGLARSVIRVLKKRGVAREVLNGRSLELPKEFHIDEMVAQYGSLYERLCQQRKT
jgi:glycosyltransferase involved in cell wall biosynthesis